jgi:hypothetical protein
LLPLITFLPSLAAVLSVHECPAAPDLDRVESAPLLEKGACHGGRICIIGAVPCFDRLDVIVHQKIESI